MLLLTPFHRASRIKSVVRKIMLSGSASVLGDYKFMQTASPLFVCFEALATKLSLAEEFQAIGDTDGARSLIQEVLAEAQGDLRRRAERMRAELG